MITSGGRGPKGPPTRRNARQRRRLRPRWWQGQWRRRGRRLWRWWALEIDGDGAKWAGPGRREGAVVEARVASMVAQSEAVMATRVALIMGAGIAAMAAVNGGRLGGGGGLDRARGASTIPAERSGSGKGGYSTLLWAHALVSGSIGSYLEGSCQWSRSRAPEPNGWASKAGRAHGQERGVRGG